MKQASGLKASHAEMRNTNLSLILNLLLQEHILSRADLSKRTGLTRATVSSLVDELLTLGYIREIGTTDDGLIGKPAVLLELHTEKIFAVAVLLQDDSLIVAKVDLTGQLSCVMKKPLRTIKPVPVTRLMNEMLHTMLRGMEERGQKLAGIGLSVPSPILDRKLVYSHSLKPLENFNFYDVLAREFRCPIFVENDADAGTLAESWFGSAAGSPRVYYLIIHHGIGSGFAYDRAPYYGTHKITPEFGHIVLVPNGAACFCGNRGCVSAVASDMTLSNYMLNGGQLTDDLYLDMDRLARAVPRTIQQLTRASAQQMPSYVWDCADLLGIGLANLMNTLCPDQIIVSGSIFEIPGFFDRTVQSAQRSAHPMLSSRMRISRSQFGNDAPLIGAGAFALRELYANPGAIDAVYGVL